jgi:hypothetical protein
VDYSNFNPAKKFVLRGIQFNRPLDAIPDGQYAFLQNIRSYVDGTIIQRPGLTNTVPLTPTGATDYIHSGEDLDNYNSGSTGAGGYRFLGYNSGLYFGNDHIPSSAALVESGWSGNPLSLVPSSSNASPVPWMYVYDSLKQKKYTSAYVVAAIPAPFPIGLAIPGQSASTAWTVPVVTSGTGSNLTGKYFYRYRLRDPNTGVIGNPGPANYTAVDAGGGGAFQMTMPAIAYPIGGSGNYYLIDIFRFGGAVNDWRQVGSAPADGTTVFNDNTSDTNVLSSETLDFTRGQPWITPDITRNITCTIVAATATSGSVLTRSGGDQFNPFWLAGTPITVPSNAVATLRRYISSTQIEVNENLAAASGVNVQVVGALVSNQPLPFAWGPYGTGESGLTFFACGSPTAPGTVFWTNGNDIDSTDLPLSLDITDASDPLMNGCIYSGRAFVWSTTRLWELVPNLFVPNQFVAQLVPGSRGMFTNWGFAVGDYIYYIGEDGIYMTDGSSTPQSVTDRDLYKLFPHDSQPAQQVVLPNPGNAFATPLIIPPADPALLKTWRLCWGDGELFFDYFDVGSSVSDPRNRSFMLDTRGERGWVYDQFAQSGYIFRYWEHGTTIGGVATQPHRLLVGIGATLYAMGGPIDDTQPIVCQIMTGAQDLGDARSLKIIGDAWLNAIVTSGMGVSGQLLGTDNASSLSTVTLAANNTRQDNIFDVSQAVPGALERTVGFYVTATVASSAQQFQLFEWNIYWVPKPEVIDKRPTDWTDDGYKGMKYVRGLVIEANTAPFGNRTINVQYDGGTVGATLTVNQLGQSEQAYTVEPPIYAHELRLVPIDPSSCQLYSVRYIWDQYTEYFTARTPVFNGGTPAAKFVQGIRFTANTSNMIVSFQILYDGGQVGPTFSGAFNGKETVAFPSILDFPTEAEKFPFIGHSFQIRPLGKAEIFLDETELIWEPVPECSVLWQTQETSHDIAGFHSLREARIAYLTGCAGSGGGQPFPPPQPPGPLPPTPPPPPPPPVGTLALQAYWMDGQTGTTGRSDIWTSKRINGTWNAKSLYYSIVQNPPPGFNPATDGIEGFSQGAVSPLLFLSVGALVSLDDTSVNGRQLYYISGNSPPSVIDNINNPDLLDFFTVSQGPFEFSNTAWVIGAYKITPTTFQLAVYSSINGTSWTLQGLPSAPNGTNPGTIAESVAVYWDGVDHLLHVAFQTAPNIFSLVEFDMTLSQWTNQHDPVTLPSGSILFNSGLVVNSVLTALFYMATVGTNQQLYQATFTAMAWTTGALISGAAATTGGAVWFNQAIQDPTDVTTFHVFFTFRPISPPPITVYYARVTNGTVNNTHTFPTNAGIDSATNSFGHGVILSGVIFVPFDDAPGGLPGPPIYPSLWMGTPLSAPAWSSERIDNDASDIASCTFLTFGDPPNPLTDNILTITTEYGSQQYILPPSPGQFTRFYLPLASQKAGWRRYQITAPTGMRLFVRDTFVWVRPWGSATAEYIKAQPFGDNSRQWGARI